MSGFLNLSAPQANQAIAQLAQLQINWAGHLALQNVPVGETSLDDLVVTQAPSERPHWWAQVEADFAPAERGLLELYFDPREHFGSYRHPTGSFVDLEFIEDVVINTERLLGLSGLLYASHPAGDWKVLRLLPPRFLLSAAHYAYGAEALNLVISNHIAPSATVATMLENNERPYCLASQGQEVHGQRDLDPFWVAVHDTYHHLLLARLGRQGRATLLVLHHQLSAAAGELAAERYIEQGLHIILDSAPFGEINPARFYARVMSKAIQLQRANGTPDAALRPFLKHASTLLEDFEAEQNRVKESLL